MTLSKFACIIGYFGIFSSPLDKDECFTEETFMVDPYHTRLNPIYGKLFEDGHFCIPKVQGKFFRHAQHAQAVAL